MFYFFLPAIQFKKSQKCIWKFKKKTVFSFRCKIPAYTNDTYDIQSEFHALLVSQTIPITSKGDHSKCTVNEADDNKTISNNQSTRACSEWVYDRSEFFSTFVTQVRHRAECRLVKVDRRAQEVSKVKTDHQICVKCRIADF